MGYELLPAMGYKLGRSSFFWLKISTEKLSFELSEAKSSSNLGKESLSPKVEI